MTTLLKARNNFYRRIFPGRRKNDLEEKAIILSVLGFIKALFIQLIKLGVCFFKCTSNYISIFNEFLMYDISQKAMFRKRMNLKLYLTFLFMCNHCYKHISYACM